MLAALEILKLSVEGAVYVFIECGDRATIRLIAGHSSVSFHGAARGVFGEFRFANGFVSIASRVGGGGLIDGIDSVQIANPEF